MRALKFAALAAAAALVGIGLASAAEAPPPPQKNWSFDGLFGTFDRAAVRRGHLVYKEVCAACHGVKLLAFRDLQRVGYSEGEVKAIAAQVEVQDGPNDQGEMFKRPGRPAERFPSPFANEQAARAANNGASPPDLSLMTKARKGGADYLHALLTGYGEPPKGMKAMEGLQYNKYFPGQQIAMPSPLNEGQVTFPDGTKATAEQMSLDVTTFLAFAAEPELEDRKRLGVKVLLFVIVLTGMLFAVKREIWSALH